MGGTLCERIVGANSFAKAIFQTIRIRRMYRPIRE
jgi:hypothetical protein